MHRCSGIIAECQRFAFSVNRGLVRVGFEGRIRFGQQLGFAGIYPMPASA